MRQLWLAVGAACAAAAFAGSANAQVNTMPGQVVGTTVNFNTSRVGQPVPRAGAPVGQPLNIPQESQFLRRYDPSKPLDVFRGTNLTPGQVVAPVVGVGDQSTFDKLYDKLKSVVGLTKPGELRAPNYTPGIIRRGHERVEERMWRRD